MRRRARLVGVSSALYLDRYESFDMYQSFSFGYALGKVIPCCYSFADSSSVLVTDTLVEGP